MLIHLVIFAAIDPAVSVILVGLLGPLAAYLAAARKLSGRIKDSDATELWAESRAIREYASERVRVLDEHVATLEKRISEVEGQNADLAAENRQLQHEIYELRNTIHELQAANGTLTHLLEKEQSEVARLHWEAEHAPRRRHSDPPIPETDVGGEHDEQS